MINASVVLGIAERSDLEVLVIAARAGIQVQPGRHPGDPARVPARELADFDRGLCWVVIDCPRQSLIEPKTPGWRDCRGVGQRVGVSLLTGSTGSAYTLKLVATTTHASSLSDLGAANARGSDLAPV